jgi:two-component system response regulator FlrC
MQKSDSISKELFGQDERIIQVLHNAQNLALSKVPILILGEVGIGKKSLASFIHAHSSRKEEPLMYIDCLESSHDIEKKILGHRDEISGRFQKGILELCNKGTIVISNIDSVDENFQKKLFKIIHELSDYEIDVRFIFTSSKNMAKLVGIGRFHRPLFIYFSENQLTMLPLRERKDDIIYIIEEFLKIHSQLNPDSLAPAFSNEAKLKLMNHYWGNNLLELFSVINNSIDQANSNQIDLDNLVMGERKTNIILNDHDEEGFKLMSLKEAERLLIKKALIHTSENRTQAAKILGVSIRTLRNKINEYRSEGTNYFTNLR